MDEQTRLHDRIPQTLYAKVERLRHRRSLRKRRRVSRREIVIEALEALVGRGKARPEVGHG